MKWKPRTINTNIKLNATYIIKGTAQDSQLLIEGLALIMDTVLVGAS